ncbi:hypothetical protein [Chenggangzhangella methanolivorans]|uniref:Uncharacterized protein n=1 Tax=Chenggangzhangella methanolivorans TaxID=1437009 RepID=A0A9E6RBD1_9HYPH|nr:hypothetical protein [Chenggangzhangella methanolivorans]QZO01631.1 hypothetical protein K6K41_09635 [Chenggangzhangella methanolivorans]
MKTLILSTAMIMGLGAAAPAMAQSVYIGPGGGGDRGDCRMVEKKVVKNNKTVITKERQCDGDRRVYREGGDRYVERRDSGPGVYIGR